MRKPNESLFDPEELDSASGNSFRLIFQKLPSVTFHLKEVNLPGISISSINNPTPGHDWNLPGSTITFDSLELSFIVDEKYENWKEIYNWIMELYNPDTGRSTGDLQNQLMEAQLYIKSNRNNSIRVVKFHNIFPTTISSIDFSTESVGEPLIASVSLSYTTYNMEAV